jgi:hypothetical protein
MHAPMLLLAGSLHAALLRLPRPLTVQLPLLLPPMLSLLQLLPLLLSLLPRSKLAAPLTQGDCGPMRAVGLPCEGIEVLTQQAAPGSRMRLQPLVHRQRHGLKGRVPRDPAPRQPGRQPASQGENSQSGGEPSPFRRPARDAAAAEGRQADRCSKQRAGTAGAPGQVSEF